MSPSLHSELVVYSAERVQTPSRDPDRPAVGQSCEGRRFQTRVLTRRVRGASGASEAVRFNGDFRCPYTLGRQLRSFNVEYSHWRSSKILGFAMRLVSTIFSLSA